MDPITRQSLAEAVELDLSIAMTSDPLGGHRICGWKLDQPEIVIQKFDRITDMRNAWPAVWMEMERLRGEAK